MTNQEWQKHTDKIHESLEKDQLKSAFELIGFLISELNDWKLIDRLDELENTYRNMLHYVEEGIKDPQRDSIYRDLLRSTYELSDSIQLKIQVKNSTGYYFNRKRTHDLSTAEDTGSLILQLEDVAGKMALNSLLEESDGKNSVNLALEKEIETITAKLFHQVWMSEAWKLREKELFSAFLNNKIYPEAIRSLLISALTLNQLFFFDEQKIILLFEACQNPDEEIRQRALTGILLILRKYDKRIALYPEINNRIRLLEDDKSSVINIRNIILQFILSKETEKITRKITEEILPEMMKISPNLSKKIKLEDLIGESGIDEKNPEWQSIIEEAGLSDKLQEFTELQMEGADVMHSSFLHLKTFPFFNEISNWFLPFTTNLSIFNGNFTNGQPDDLLNTLEKASFLCNSDKYSLFFSVMSMPEAYRKMIAGQFAAESSAMEEMLGSELPDNSKKTKNISNQYIRDLYRFYKLHPRKNDFEDIFEIKPDFFQIKNIERLIADDQSLLIIGEYYFNRNYFEEAAVVFDKLLQKDKQNDMLYQKKGYCMQMTDQPEKALEAYLKAELIDASNTWTIRKLAYCYRMLKMPEEALLYYRKLEQLNPDNMSVQLNIGHCYLELKDYTAALKCYFKVEYLDKKGNKAWRPIAWCSFLTGKYEQSKNYYEKILSSEKYEAGDYLNAGHTELVMGNIKNAVNYYLESAKHPDNSLQQFIDSFNNDIPELIQTGINPKDIPLILDQLRYRIKEIYS